MTQLSLQIPQVNQPDATEDPKIASNFTAIQNVINGNLDTSNLAAGVVDGRGSVNIPTSESRTNTAYGTLATPDQVTGIVLPANGLIAVWYQATWQESVASAGRAAIFLGANQLQVASGAVLATEAAAVPGTPQPNVARSLGSAPFGLVSAVNFSVAYAGDATTGQAVGGLVGTGLDYGYDFGGTVDSTNPSRPSGGPCYIFAAAGTYTVSVQFKASSGSVTASNRKLWVRSMAFS